MSSHHSELASPPSDAISAVSFGHSEGSRRLLVASWDRNVYFYDTQAAEGGELLQKIEHRAPVLDVCFGADENEAYSAGLDWDVNRIDLQAGTLTRLSSHTAGVKSIAYSKQHKLLVSASWDSTLQIHSLTSTPSGDGTPTIIVSLPAKPFSISMSPTKLVVAMAQRLVHIYDLDSLAKIVSEEISSASNLNEQMEQLRLDVEPWQRRESPLKFMTRAVACMPNDAGYASSSIEGRVAVEWFDPSPESQARKYAFKCHRQTAPINGEDQGATGGESVDVVYPVNALAFYPMYGSFASGGGDGVVTLWDGIAKRRIRQYPKLKSSVAALAFSEDGKCLAIGISPGFEDGKEGGVGEEGQDSVKLIIRELGPGEAKGKAAK